MADDMHRRRVWALAVAALAVALALGYFGTRDQSPAPAATVEKLSIAMPMVPHATLLYIAAAKGYFAEEGLEVTVVLPEASLECARDRAETLRIAIRGTNLTHLGQTLPGPSASFGVAAYPGHGEDLTEVLKAADQALYRAKQAGRDQVCVAEDPAGTDTSPVATKAA